MTDLEWLDHLDDMVQQFGSPIIAAAKGQAMDLRKAELLMTEISGKNNAQSLVIIYRMITTGYLKYAGIIWKRGQGGQSVISTGREIAQMTMT